MEDKRFDFETLVDRRGAGTLKESMTPQSVRDAGLVNYWGAEFEFASCPAFSEGVMNCARRGLYAFTVQNSEYNEKIRWWLKRVRDWDISPDWIVPTHGTIFALATAIRMCVGDGQNMIVLCPDYSRYKQACDRMGKGTVVSRMIYHPDEIPAYTVDFADLEEKMADPKNTLLVFSDPNNPTGLRLSAGDAAKIAALSEKYGVVVFSDEIFADVNTDGEKTVPYVKAAGENPYAITCTSFGKCFSLTGVNHANVIIPDKGLRERYIRQKYYDHYGSIDPMLYAGLMNACSEDGAAFVEALCGVIGENRRLFTERLESLIRGAKVVRSGAGFTLWVDYTGTGLSESQLKELLDRLCFEGDPGSDYGVSDMFYRYNIAVPTKEIEKSMDFIANRVGK